MTEPEMATDGEAVPGSAPLTADAVIEIFEGDAHAAIEALLSDRSYLVRELQYASLAMGFGFTRGWRPKIKGPFH